MIIILFILIFIIIIVLDCWPDNKQRKRLIKDATGDENFYNGCGRKFQPSDSELRDIIERKNA